MNSLEEKEIAIVSEIPPDVRAVIDEEAQKDVLLIKDERPEEAGDYREIATDYRKCVYLFLRWVGAKFKPHLSLYAGSGFDQMPKLALGQDRIVHTSLEDYGPGGEKYFGALGEGQKAVADNVNLPFPDSKFSAVLLLDLPFEAIDSQLDELVRVLDKEGIIVLNRSILTNTNEPDSSEHLSKHPLLKPVPVPEELNEGKGMSETKFFLFRKKKNS